MYAAVDKSTQFMWRFDEDDVIVVETSLFEDLLEEIYFLASFI